MNWIWIVCFMWERRRKLLWMKPWMFLQCIGDWQNGIDGYSISFLKYINPNKSAFHHWRYGTHKGRGCWNCLESMTLHLRCQIMHHIFGSCIGSTSPLFLHLFRALSLSLFLPDTISFSILRQLSCMNVCDSIHSKYVYMRTHYDHHNIYGATCWHIITQLKFYFSLVENLEDWSGNGKGQNAFSIPGAHSVAHTDGFVAKFIGFHSGIE